MYQMATKDEMIKEANKRLKMIDHTGRLAAEFRKGNIEISQISFSASEEKDAELNPKLFKRIEEIEAKYNVVAYHVIRSWIDRRDGGFTIMDNILIVQPQMGEWQMDRAHIQDYQCVFVYALNYENDKFSEFGEIQYGVDEDGVLYRM